MNPSNTSEERQFFDALDQGDLERVRDLVNSRPALLEANDYRSFGATPVTKVCWNGNVEMLSTLIELGADVNRCSDWEMGPWSPLHCAVATNNRALAHKLLDHGAILDVHSAAGLGRTEDLTQLLDAAPERVTELGGDGCHPLHFADTIAVAEILLDRGADLEARCLDHYSTPVQYLADRRPEVARYLFAKGAMADVFSAVLANDLNVVQRLLTEHPEAIHQRVNEITFPPGPDHNVQSILEFSVGHDATPLHAAAKANCPSMIPVLVQAGLPANVRGGYDDAMPLHIAAWNDHREVAAALLEHGAAIDARSGKLHNNSPAGWAIVAGSANVFDLLMDTGAAMFPWFEQDARAALDGKFACYKAVPHENYQRVWNRLVQRIA